MTIAFARLMSRRIIEGDKSEFICAILTRDAVGHIAKIHTWMPIALSKDAEAARLHTASRTTGNDWLRGVTGRQGIAFPLECFQ